MILSYIASLTRLGFDTSLAAGMEMAPPPPVAAAFEATGASLFRLPWYGSVEEVLQRHAGAFELVVLHRMSNAHRYLALVRHYAPRARIVYAVADLHHLRLSRQAAVQKRPELQAVARSTRLIETVAALSADAVLTHSSAEASLIGGELGAEKVHLVRWAEPVARTPVRSARAHGIGLIGNYRHEPNADAARWLTGSILPLVRRRLPDLRCVLAGRFMPSSLRATPGVIALGDLESVRSLHERVRLMVAPLAFGAGAKIKVVESFAAGRACLCTPIAAEGLNLPGALASCVAPATDDGFADAICRLHEDPALCARLGRIGREWVRDMFNTTTLDAALRTAIGLTSKETASCGTSAH